MNTEQRDICNICGLPFLKDGEGEYINHGHKLLNKNDPTDEQRYEGLDPNDL